MVPFDEDSEHIEHADSELTEKALLQVQTVSQFDA